MKKKKETKKVYRANTKAIFRLLMVAFIIVAIAILAIPVKNGVTYLYLNTWKSYNFEKYHLQVNLPRAFTSLKEEKEDLSDLYSSFISTESSVKVNEKYVIQKPEVIYSGGNILNGVSVMIQCLLTETKTTKTLDEIADNQHVLVRIYYEDEYKIQEPQKEFMTILNTEAVKTSTELQNKKGTKILTQYLVPMEDKEVTITFMGKKEHMEKAEKEIEKIMEKMKNI